MRSATSREDATLLDTLIDGFEKNEIWGGYHWRSLPMPDEEAAARKIASWIEEVRRWKGPPARIEDRAGRRLAAWPDLELRQAGRGVMVRVRAPNFNEWWNAKDTWSGDPMAEVHDWIEEDGGSA
jgi:hypothetical protein